MNKLKRLFQAKFLGLVFSDTRSVKPPAYRIKSESLKVRFPQDTYPAFYVNYFYLTDALEFRRQFR
ncbi:MAG: hypothetical protein KME49_25330 [Brasilonema octagenarum HA4186-MV1]|nr:hypothetical protein [Brasilonema octagenarum HA4186-MV1]